MQCSPPVYAQICGSKCNAFLFCITGKKTTIYSLSAAGVTFERAGDAAVDGGEAGLSSKFARRL